jgi:hypothetical protein
MADANTAFVTLACVQGALTLALVGATVYYARKTHDIASATREQAEASARMVEATEASRLGAFQPRLRLSARTGQVDDSPEVLVCAANHGRGPAQNCHITIAHPLYCFDEGFRMQVVSDADQEVMLSSKIRSHATASSDQQVILMADYQDIEGNWYHTDVELEMPMSWVQGHGRISFRGPSRKPFRKELADDS